MLLTRRKLCDVKNEEVVAATQLNRMRSQVVLPNDVGPLLYSAQRFEQGQVRSPTSVSLVNAVFSFPSVLQQSRPSQELSSTAPASVAAQSSLACTFLHLGMPVNGAVLFAQTPDEIASNSAPSRDLESLRLASLCTSRSLT